MRRPVLLVAVALLAPSIAQANFFFARSGGMIIPTADVFVSTTGNDANPGTLSQPVATLIGARNLIAADLASGSGGLGKNRSYTVMFETGVYPLASCSSDQSAGEGGVTASGGEAGRSNGTGVPAGATLTSIDTPNATFQVLYTAYPGEAVTISGGCDVSPSTGQSWTSTTFGGTTVWETTISQVAAGKQNFGEIWVNDQKATWTEVGVGGNGLTAQPFAIKGSISSSGSGPPYTADQVKPVYFGDRNGSSGDNTFGFNGGTCPTFPSVGTAELCSGWADLAGVRIFLAGDEEGGSLAPIVSVNNSTNVAVINAHPDIVQGGLFPSQTWWRENVCNDLPGSPGGTMYLARTSACGLSAGTLVYVPRASDISTGLSSSSIVIPILDTLIKVSNAPQDDVNRGSGSSTNKNVGNVEFSHLTFAYTNSTIYSQFPDPRGESGGYMCGESCIMGENTIAAFEGVGASNVVLDHDMFKHLAESATLFPGGLSNSITNSIVHDVGGVAFADGPSIVAANYYYWSTGFWQPSFTSVTTANNNLAENNHFYDCAQLLRGTACAAVDEGHQNTFDHNTVEGTSSFGLVMGGTPVTIDGSNHWDAGASVQYDTNQYGDYVGFNALHHIGSLTDINGNYVDGGGASNDFGALYMHFPMCGANQPTSPYSGPVGANAGSPLGSIMEYNEVDNLYASKWTIANSATTTAPGGHDSTAIYLDQQDSSCWTLRSNIAWNVGDVFMLNSGTMVEAYDNIFYSIFTYAPFGTGVTKPYGFNPGYAGVFEEEGTGSFAGQNGLPHDKITDNLIFFGSNSATPGSPLIGLPSSFTQTYAYNNNNYCNMNAAASSCLTMTEMQFAGGVNYSISAWQAKPQDAASSFTTFLTFANPATGDFHITSGSPPSGFVSPYTAASGSLSPASPFTGQSISNAGYSGTIGP